MWGGKDSNPVPPLIRRRSGTFPQGKVKRKRDESMTTFKYKGLSPDGEKVSGVVKAYNEYEAVSQLREKFTVVTHIEEVKEKKNLNPTFGATRIKDKDLAIMCSQFSIILNSGMSIVRCVEMVAEQARTPELRKMLLKVAEDVSGGYPLAQSFQNNAPRTAQRRVRGNFAFFGSFGAFFVFGGASASSDSSGSARSVSKEAKKASSSSSSSVGIKLSSIVKYLPETG